MTAKDREILWNALWQPGVLLELAILAACVGAAALLVRSLRGREAPESSIWFGSHVADGVLFPLMCLLLAFLSWRILAFAWPGRPWPLLHLAVPVLLSLVAVRLSARVLSASFANASWARTLERVIFWAASIALVLWVTGVLSSLLDEAAAIDFTLGSTHLSLRHLIEGGLAAGLVLLVTLSISAVLERQLIRGTGSDLSVRKMTANLVRALLLTVGFLVAMSMLGIDLTALSVLGGAIGVGLGLGLQRIVVNYVGGFVILAERVVRVGDVVKLDGFEGEVADIRSRYTLVRAVSGRESIVPNEMFVSQRVENLSLEGTRVAITSTVTVVHGTDVAALREKLASALAAVPRLLRDPEPSVQLSAFAPHGLELMLVGWIADPHKGFGAVRSEMNLAALAVFAQEGVEIARQQVAAVSPASAAATPADAVPPARTPLA